MPLSTPTIDLGFTGRLTLTTVTPVLVATVSAATTIFYTPYIGSTIPIYNGTLFQSFSYSELSNITSNSATGSAGPAAVGASSVYDLFVWNNAGTITLTRGPVWTNDTTRAAGTALVRTNGIWLNNATITNGPAASRGTYVGTVRSNGSSQIDYIFGAVAANGTPGFFGVWNAYNRVNVASFTGDSANSWTYATATWRSTNNQNGVRCTFVRGLDEDEISATYNCIAVPGSNPAAAGVCLDATNSFSGTTGLSGAAALYTQLPASYNGIPGLGVHFIQAVEFVNGGTDCAFIGDFGVAFVQSGLYVTLRA